MKAVGSVLHEKKIIETNFCSVERQINDDDSLTFESPKVHNLKLYFAENKIKGKGCIMDNGCSIGFEWSSLDQKILSR